jgi:hypothetical protein
MAMVQSSLGGRIPDDKFKLLWGEVQREGWSEARFNSVLHWFLQNRPYQAWSISDWFQYSVKVYPWAWYASKCSESHNPLPEMDRYKLSDGTIVYKWKDGVEIPGLEKLPDWK